MPPSSITLPGFSMDLLQSFKCGPSKLRLRALHLEPSPKCEMASWSNQHPVGQCQIQFISMGKLGRSCSETWGIGRITRLWFIKNCGKCLCPSIKFAACRTMPCKRVSVSSPRGSKLIFCPASVTTHRHKEPLKEVWPILRSRGKCGP